MSGESKGVNRSILSLQVLNAMAQDTNAMAVDP